MNGRQNMGTTELPTAHLYLEAEGIAVTPDTIEQLRVLTECVRLYDSRGRSYGQVWKQYGALASLLNAARKVDRLMAIWWHSTRGAALHKDALDDAYDCINYMTFFMRLAIRGNITGTAPTRPEVKQ